MLDQRRRHWADVVQMLYKCLLGRAGTVQYIFGVTLSALTWQSVVIPANTINMVTQCWFIVGHAS